HGPRSVPRALGAARTAGGTPRVRTRPHAPSHRPRHRALSRLSTWTPAVRRGPRTHPTALGHLVNAFVSPRVLLPTTPRAARSRPTPGPRPRCGPGYQLVSHPPAPGTWLATARYPDRIPLLDPRPPR